MRPKVTDERIELSLYERGGLIAYSNLRSDHIQS